MRKMIACIALFFSAGLYAAVPTSALADFIDSEMPVSGVPGLAYASVENGEMAVSGERGVLKKGEPAEVTRETTFIIGSVSKSFTALGVMQLVETDAVKLDNPISDYLNVFDGQPSSQITIRQLLSHTSGYSMYQGNLSQTEFSMDSKALEKRVDIIAATPPAYPSGSKWDYSNVNYQILGRLIEMVSGQRFPDYVEENILKPGGMTNSFVYDTIDNTGLAHGHRPWFGTKQPLSQNMTGVGAAPQGGIVATASDLARFLAIMMNKQDDILSAEGKALMMSPAGDVSPFYGFGWFIDSERGVVYHSGSNPGYEALATMIPGKKKGAAVLTNAGSGTGFGETIQLRNGLTARLIAIDYNGEAGSLPQKLTFIGVAALPVLFLIGTVSAWRKRANIRAKSGLSGKFSLWFPLVMTIMLAVIIFAAMPKLQGVPLSAIQAFQPDMGLSLIASAITGLLWSISRLIIAYTAQFAS